MRNTHLCERAWVAQIANDPFKMSLPCLIFFFFFDWMIEYWCEVQSNQPVFFFKRYKEACTFIFPLPDRIDSSWEHWIDVVYDVEKHTLEGNSSWIKVESLLHGSIKSSPFPSLLCFSLDSVCTANNISCASCVRIDQFLECPLPVTLY